MVILYDVDGPHLAAKLNFRYNRNKGQILSIKSKQVVVQIKLY